jgi:hypothetical protein
MSEPDDDKYLDDDKYIADYNLRKAIKPLSCNQCINVVY